MSLKTFHLVFVTALTALAFGTGVWKLLDYSDPGGRVADLLVGLGGLLAGMLVIVYGRYFLRKMKGIGYL
jgi:hypothetical protein